MNVYYVLGIINKYVGRLVRVNFLELEEKNLVL